MRILPCDAEAAGEHLGTLSKWDVGGRGQVQSTTKYGACRVALAIALICCKGPSLLELEADTLSVHLLSPDL